MLAFEMGKKNIYSFRKGGQNKIMGVQIAQNFCVIFIFYFKMRGKCWFMNNESKNKISFTAL